MNRQMSFRDPGGQVLVSRGRIFRKITVAGTDDIGAFLSSTIARNYVEDGRIINSWVTDSAQIVSMVPETFISDAKLIIEHDKVFFSSYPSEWPPEMLYASACLTIDLAEMFLSENLGLKDATPYNILFRGPHPVFVDVLSFERRDPTDPIWLPLAQFERTFLLPLLINSHFKIPLSQIFLESREGIAPEKVYELCSLIKRFTPPFILSVTLPVLLGKRRKTHSEATYNAKRIYEHGKTRFILGHTFRRLRRLLVKVAPVYASQPSVWSDYDVNNSYSEKDYATKSAFIESIMHQYTPRTVLDIGCNTGRFSRIAARNGAKVVAIDNDPVVIGRLWSIANKENLDILPLVINLANPTPATGWLNSETLSFIDRATGVFDTIFMLAVIHHLLVTERIPLLEILTLAARLTTNLLVIEFVGRDDPMFRILCRGRMELFDWYTREIFEQTSKEVFEIIQSVCLEDTQRWLYILKRRDA